MNVIIVDDEQPAINVLSTFVGRVPYLSLQLATLNAFEALDFIQTNRVDLLFLDVEMPDINGIELLQSLHNPPLVILTTAYDQYALKAYNLDVIDYLLKPIPFERFLKGVNKARMLFGKTETPTEEFLSVKIEYQNVRIPLVDILFIEGLKDYVKIHTAARIYLTRLNLKGILLLLPDHEFKRIHRSYIVAISKVNSFQKTELTIGATKIPIGNSYRADILDNF